MRRAIDPIRRNGEAGLWRTAAAHSVRARTPVLLHIATRVGAFLGVALALLALSAASAASAARENFAVLVGELTGCQNLAVAYYMGRGVPKDVTQAVALERKACDSGQSLPQSV